MARFCRPDYIQHNESMAAYGQGTAGLLRMFDSAAAGPTLGASHEVTVMARGDLVVRINTREMPGGKQPLMIFNLFRLQDGLIAEHWDGYSGTNPAMPAK
jgi:predicted SnoaL-like aldol condensation-catalyzing enzyme